MEDKIKEQLKTLSGLKFHALEVGENLTDAYGNPLIIGNKSQEKILDLIDLAFNLGKEEDKWVSVKTRFPERLPDKAYSQVPCLVNKRYDWERKGEKGSYYQIQILVFNHEHECWDDESGDDHDCEIERVTHWQPLPLAPRQ